MRIACKLFFSILILKVGKSTAITMDLNLLSDTTYEVVSPSPGTSHTNACELHGCLWGGLGFIKLPFLSFSVLISDTSLSF